MRHASLLLTVLALAGGRAASAQASADEVVAAWRAGWERVYAGGEITADEQSVRTVDGPRGALEVEMDGRVAYRPGRPPARTVERLRVGGREVDPQSGARHQRRLGRAFGRAGRLAAAPPPLPDRLLAGAGASGLTPTSLGEAPAWRVALAADGGEAQAWFTRSASAPRLLAVRMERGHTGGRLVRTVRYVRVAGLDLPSEVRAEVTVRQRRRLRDYVVTLATVGRYSGHRVR